MKFNSLNEMASTLIKAIPFCHWLNMEILHVDETAAGLRFKNRPEIIGNHIQGMLHGGVISTALDSVGGLLVMANTFDRFKDATYEEQIAKLSKVGTIDIRVDYLRPGKGAEFIASAALLRGGNKVAVTHMDLHNEKGDLLAVGTATYLMG